MCTIEVVDRQYMWMLQAGDEARLAPEALNGVAILSDPVQDDLDGHSAIHRWLIGAVYDGHAAASNFLTDFVSAQCRPLHGYFIASTRRMSQRPIRVVCSII